MSSLRPSIEAERLVVVQRAARHVLDEDARGNSTFGTMDIFPLNAGQVPRSGTSEYTWRAQLTWTWAKAGYFSRKDSGDGRWSYSLLAEGREALERIASEPAIASFYVKTKRSSTGNYPVEWYQPPQLVRRTAEGEPESDVEEDFDGEELEDLDLGGDSGDALGGDALGGDAGGGDPVSIYFERSTAVLEVLAERLVSVEREVKGQTEVLLEAVGRLERVAPKPTLFEDGPATRGDVGRAAAEIASAFLRRESADVESVRFVAENLRAALGTSDASSQVIISKFDALRDAMVEGRISGEKKSDEVKVALLLAMRSGAEAAEKKLADVTDKLEGKIAAALAVVASSNRSTDIEEVRAIASDLKADLAAMSDNMETLADSSEGLQQKFFEMVTTFRQQMSGISDAAVRVAKMAEELLDAARFVSKEMTGVARERALRESSPETVLARGEAAADKFDALSDGIRGLSSLGAGLIRPSPGSAASSLDLSASEESEDLK